MAKSITERVDKYRKNGFDRISLLVERGGRQLIRAMAVREGVSMTELLRRAILARAGLRMMPYPEKLDGFDKIETADEAHTAIRKLQMNEESSEIIQSIIDNLSPEGPQKGFTVQMDHSDIFEFEDAMKTIGKAIEAEKQDRQSGPPVTVHLTGREVGILRRFLSNITQDRDAQI